jgi:hypothetical protein
MLYDALSRILNIPGQLICDFLVYAAGPNKIGANQVATVELSDLECHGVMLLYI